MQSCRQQTWQGLGLLALLLAIQVGCGRYSHVNWRNPGTAEMQQNRAIAEHDPYPDPDAGPEVSGGRPRGFETPPAEPAWLQKRASPIFSPHSSVAPQYHAQPIYTTPAYSPNGVVPTVQPNYTTPTAQPNYTTPAYQPSFMPLQPAQPSYSPQ